MYVRQWCIVMAAEMASTGGHTISRSRARMAWPVPSMLYELCVHVESVAVSCRALLCQILGLIPLVLQLGVACLQNGGARPAAHALLSALVSAFRLTYSSTVVMSKASILAGNALGASCTKYIILCDVFGLKGSVRLSA